MSVEVEIEEALLPLLRAIPGLLTVEATIRECLFGQDKFATGFRATELPALNFSATVDPVKTSQFTTTQKQRDVPITICVVTRHQKRKTAEQTARDFQNQVEAVLDTLRRTGNALGPNRLILGDYSSSMISFEEKPHCFATGTTAATITCIEEMQF